MKNTTLLIVTSMVSIALLAVHITDDMVHGYDKLGPANITVSIAIAVLLYGTLVLAHRRSGHVLMLLAAILALGMPIIHLRSHHLDELVKSDGAFRFILTLYVLGATGIFGVALAVRGLWSIRSRAADQGSAALN
jgi:hypothetical protein